MGEHSPEFVKLVDEVKTRIQEVSVEEVRAKQDQKAAFHLIDVREEEEWNKGHIVGARHLCRGILERDIVQALPDKDAEIVLYCGGGFRSALSADTMGQMGYKRIRSMAGGYSAWRKAGAPTTKPDPPA